MHRIEILELILSLRESVVTWFKSLSYLNSITLHLMSSWWLIHLGSAINKCSSGGGELQTRIRNTIPSYCPCDSENGEKTQWLYFIFKLTYFWTIIFGASISYPIIPIIYHYEVLLAPQYKKLDAILFGSKRYQFDWQEILNYWSWEQMHFFLDWFYSTVVKWMKTDSWQLPAQTQLKSLISTRGRGELL